MKITMHNIADVFGAKASTIETMQLKGYELVEEYFVDSSGFGLDSEPAYTVDQFLGKLGELLTREEYANGLTAKITSQGQFQVYVGLFKRVGKSKMRKIANNTYRIETERGGYKIRLHDTDIFECIPLRNGGVVYKLDSGGWHSKTTKDRISDHLQDRLGVGMYQKNWEWYIGDYGDSEPILYHDGITLEYDYKDGKIKEYTKELQTA